MREQPIQKSKYSVPRYFVPIPALLLICLISAACTSTPKSETAEPHSQPDAVSLKKDMVRFDRAYIPALALTSQMKHEASVQAMNRLQTQWEKFQGEYSDLSAEEEAWREALTTIELMILEAERRVVQEQDLQGAHQSLEGIRMEFLLLREAAGIDYYLDLLTLYHEPMEEIVLAGAAVAETKDFEAHAEQIQGAFEEARRAWNQVVTAEFDADLFGFGPRERQRLRENVTAESQALQRLENALESGEGVAKAAVSLKPPFADLFMLFGNFEGLGVKK